MILQGQGLHLRRSAECPFHVAHSAGFLGSGDPGDVGVVNGVVWPKVEVARGLYRLRLLNAATYSVWNLHFAKRAVLGDRFRRRFFWPLRRRRITSG